MDALSAAPATMCTSRVTLAAGTTTTITNTGTINFSIRGKAYSKVAMTNAATPTTDANTGNAFLGVLANFGSIFLVGLNHSGTVKVAQGTIEALDTSGNFIKAPQLPAMPTDFCPIGYLVIQAGSTADATHGWRFGTDNNSSVTGITYTIQDLMTMPDRPQVS